MAKKIISDLSIKRAVKITLLFMVRHKQWEELDYYRRLPEIKVQLEEMIRKGFLVPKGKKFILTGEGKKLTEIFSQSRRKLKTIFYSFAPVENTEKNPKRR